MYRCEICKKTTKSGEKQNKKVIETREKIYHYIGKDGRIEYQVTNKGKKKVSGALRLEFDTKDSVYVIYDKLKKGETKKGVIAFTDSNFSNVNEYKLVEVNKRELKKILKNKK